jgi:hypothetical protein
MKLIRIDDIANFDHNLGKELIERSQGQPCAFGLFCEVFLNALPWVERAFEQLDPGYKLILDRAHAGITPENWTVPTLYIDWHLLRVKHAIDTKLLEINSEWNPNSNKFLFLTGKPHKIQRIRLLWMYAQANLLDRAVWSLFLDENTATKCQMFLPELDQSQLQAFLEEHEFTPDNIETDTFEAQPITSSWWQKNIYEQSSLNVISATEFDNNTFDMVLCEKIWKPIVNCQPFIIAGQQNTLPRLNELGFRTFEQYMPHPDYSLESNTQKKLEKIVKNTVGFLDNIHLYREQINQDVEYNYTHFFTVYKNNIQQLQECVNDVQIVLDFTGKHL